MSARFERMCEDSEDQVAAEAASRIKRLFEASRPTPELGGSRRRLVNDGLQAIGFILEQIEARLEVGK